MFAGFLIFEQISVFWFQPLYRRKIEIQFFFKSSRSHVFFKIDAMKNFAILTGKHLCWSLILIKFQTWRPESLLKKDFNIGVFLWILQNFQEQLFYVEHHWWLLLSLGIERCSEAVACTCSVKKYFWAYSFTSKRLHHRYFPVNMARFSRQCRPNCIKISFCVHSLVQSKFLVEIQSSLLLRFKV